MQYNLVFEAIIRGINDDDDDDDDDDDNDLHYSITVLHYSDTVILYYSVCNS